jgi:hypothetical protein
MDLELDQGQGHSEESDPDHHGYDGFTFGSQMLVKDQVPFSTRVASICVGCFGTSILAALLVGALA